MGKVQRLNLLLLTVGFLIICCFNTFYAQEGEIELKSPPGNIVDWNAFGGKVLDKAPLHIKNGPDLEKAKHIMSEVGYQIDMQKIIPNSTVLGRIWHGFDTGTCGDVSGKLIEALQGTGLKCELIEGIKGSYWIGDVHYNHGAVVVEVKGEKFVFDLYAYAVFSKKGYFCALKSDEWNGMPLSEWIKRMKDRGYVTFNFISSPSIKEMGKKGEKHVAIHDEVTKNVEKERKGYFTTKDDVTEKIEIIKKNETKVWNCIKDAYDWYDKAVKTSKDPGKWQDGTPVSWFNCGMGANWQMGADKHCCDEFDKNRGKPGAWEAFQKCGWEYELKSRKEYLDKTIEECRKRYSNKK